MDRYKYLKKWEHWIPNHTPATNFDYGKFIKALNDVSKEEINKYYDDLNKQHHKNMNNNNTYHGGQKQSKCLTCKSGTAKKGPVSLGGMPTYVIMCKKLCYTFNMQWDENKNECKEVIPWKKENQ